MKLKYLPLAAVLTASAPAFAITVNMTDFSFSAPASVAFDDTATGVGYNGEAGQFTGALTDAGSSSASLRSAASLSANAPAVSPTSFTAYCAEITQSFSFNTPYQYAWVGGAIYFGGQKSTDLSRLFTATAGFVVDSATSAAVQAAIWEIIYAPGTSYDLTSGPVTVVPLDGDDQAAFAAVNVYLAHLSSYAASYSINVLTNPEHQDFVVGTIPEPGTWAMLVAGLGVLGLMARRRKR